MQTLHTLTLARGVAALTLALASLAAQADQATLTWSGGFAFDAEVHSFNLDIGSASDLRLWTTSSAAGHADPLLALFDRATGDLLSFSDDVGAPFAQVDASQGMLDAGLLVTDLAAGAYRVAVSVSPNYPAGGSWGGGYLLGTSGGHSLDSAWTVRAEWVSAAPVPEPAPTALLLGGLAVLSLVGRRRQR